MRCRRFFLLAAAFACAPQAAQAQILIGPSYGYVRYGGPGGYRVGFVRSPYMPYGYSSTRITIITVVPAPRVRRSLPPVEEPPGELPDLPVDRIRRAPKDVPLPVPKGPVPVVPVPEVPADPAPADEAARQVKLGKAAFEAEEYGRAAQRFRAANRLRPDDAPPYFLLAQSLIALGKYHEALDAILAGMARKPDWPAERFRPINLYGGNVAEYPEHLFRLDAALKKHPGDATLLFLNGYQVWFAGRKDAARPLFRQARDRLAGKPGVEAFRAACERFLKS